MMFLSLLLAAVLSSQEATQMARVSFDAGDYPKAVQALMAALSRSSQDPAVNYWLGRCYYELNDYDKSIAFAEKAVELDPSNSEYNRWLGRAYGAKAQQSRSFLLARKVKAAFETAVRLAPNNIQARRDLMEYLAQAPWIVGGSKDKAEEQIETIESLDPIEGRLARAAYLATDKKWSEARTEYLAVLDQHPARIEPYMEAASFFVDRNDSADLDQCLEAAERLNPHDPRMPFYRAVSLILSKRQTPEAESLLKSYIANSPQRSDFPSHADAAGWLRRVGG